ncbi:hypothetical protein AXA44_47860 [Rhodococcus sp. SC4]|nr:hypothetical protein AXA44_47860 [Rhodococcus sp. SC4]KXX57263.1 hypothetical protein AZG88_48575 [Rhodococcus sp. LB1]
MGRSTNATPNVPKAAMRMVLEVDLLGRDVAELTELHGIDDPLRRRRLRNGLSTRPGLPTSAVKASAART